MSNQNYHGTFGSDILILLVAASQTFDGVMACTKFSDIIKNKDSLIQISVSDNFVGIKIIIVTSFAYYDVSCFS